MPSHHVTPGEPSAGNPMFWAPYPVKDTQKVKGAVKIDGWTESERLFTLDVRTLMRTMSELLKITNSLDNVNMEFVTRSKLLEWWWAPFEIRERRVLNRNKEVPPPPWLMNLSHCLKWILERFQIL